MHFLQEVVYERFGIWLFLTIFQKETDIFVLSPHVIDRALRDIVNISFLLPHNVNVLQRHWKRVLIWFVQSDSRIFVVAVCEIYAH